MATDLKDLTHAAEAGALLKLLPARPRLLALGEPTHGEDSLLHLRNEIFRQLAEDEGYRTIALETDCLRGLAVDAYVTAGTGTLDAVMERGFSHGWGASEANRDLVRWMRAHNENRPPAEHVRFAGFDGPLEITGAASPRQALTELHDHLTGAVDPALLPCTRDTLDRLLGPDARWTEPAAMRDAARSVGRTPEAAQLRLLADDLETLVDTQAPHLRATASPEALDRARLYARTATGLLRYHHAMADPSPLRLARMVALRDRMMADNLLALAARGPAFVHSHNSHLQRERSTMHMGGQPLTWWSAGALVSTRLGERYAFAATAVGTIRHRGVDTPPPDTVEGFLYELPAARGIVDPRGLAAALSSRPPAPRVSPWFGYAPLAPARLAGLDALVFVKDLPASRPGRDAGSPSPEAGEGTPHTSRQLPQSP
ncbi:erythromycin esterase family protein [Streptomyces sp.]|uniref:erythromycin esterase family protein n=1 Tax=Streptomyces sp. TaxID=1931 RepID=UPI0028112849|nr:erythromycin esterase family protein [Streptomyces sp.]